MLCRSCKVEVQSTPEGAYNGHLFGLDTRSAYMVVVVMVVVGTGGRVVKVVLCGSWKVEVLCVEVMR